MRPYSTAVFITLNLFISICNLHGQLVEEQIDELLAGQFSSNEPGTAVLVVHEGEVLYRKAIGMADLELQTPMEPEGVFRIASITKQFTAVAILNLAEEGKLDISDDIRKYVAGFNPGGHAVTIENLLTHTSGLGNQNSIDNWDQIVGEMEINPQALVDLINNQPLDFTPGSKYKYSNFGYWLLGYIVEVTSRQPYSEYLHDHILKPMQLHHTRYDNSDEIIKNRIKGYSMMEDGFSNAAYIDMKLPYAGGGLMSNVDDLYTWHKSLYADGAPIETHNLAKAHQAYQLSTGEYTKYGYGWMIGSIQGEKSIKHDGIISGFISFSLYLPESDTFVAVLTNCDCTKEIEELSSKIAAIAIGKPYTYQKIDLPADSLLKYTGIYKSDKGAEKRVSLQNGDLMFHDLGGNKSPMVPIGNEQFAMEDGLSLLTFRKSDDGRSLHCVLNTLWDNMTWKKVSDENIVLKTYDLTTTELQEYEGKYEFKGAFTLAIYAEGDRIFGTVGSDAKEISCYQKDEFFLVPMDAKLLFKRNDQQEIIGVAFVSIHEMYADKIE